MSVDKGMPPKLKARRDELVKEIYPAGDDPDFEGIFVTEMYPEDLRDFYREGFNAAYGELFPVIEALRFYAEKWSNPECDKLVKEGGFFPYSIDETIQAEDAGSKARQALTKVGVIDEKA